jgi:hypothetical protein
VVQRTVRGKTDPMSCCMHEAIVAILVEGVPAPPTADEAIVPDRVPGSPGIVLVADEASAAQLLLVRLRRSAAQLLLALLRSYYWCCYHDGSVGGGSARGEGVRLRRPCHEEHFSSCSSCFLCTSPRAPRGKMQTKCACVFSHQGFNVIFEKLSLGYQARLQRISSYVPFLTGQVDGI